MTVTEALKARRTIRGFRPDPVPRALIEQIVADAQTSASNCNTQPWHFAVVSGAARDDLAQALVAEVTCGKPQASAFQLPDAGWDGVYRERQFACAADYYAVMGIERSDRPARNALMLKNWEFFGAPHVGFLSMPLSMGPVNAVDVGIYLQSLMLLMTEHGLASCPQGSLAYFPEPILARVPIPSGNGILCGLSFGYADEDARINQVTMPRAPVAESVTFTA